MAEDGNKADATKADAPKSDELKSDALKPDALKPDASKPDALKSDKPKPDALESDAIGSDTAKSDIPRANAPASERPPLEAGHAAHDHKAVKSSATRQSASASNAEAAGSTESPTRPGRPGSEWTASDDRGPLGRAWEHEADGRHGAHDASPSATIRPDPKSGTTDAALMRPTPGEPVPPVDAIASASAPSASGPFEQPDAAATSSSPGRPGGPTPAAETRRTSLWPVAAALIIGALIGAGSAAFVYRGYADDTQPDPRFTNLQARLDALERHPDPQPAINGLKSSVTALDNQVAALRKDAGRTQASRSPEPSAAAPSPAQTPAQTPAQVDLGPVNDKIAALQSRIDAQKSGGGDTKALEEKVTALQGALASMKTATDAATAGVSGVEGKQKEMAGQQKALAGRVMMPALAVVADSLVQQIDRGQPYAGQVDALTALGADPAKVATLRVNAATGVPSANVLAAKFEPLALPITTTAHKAPPNAGLVDRLKSGMFSIVSIRRADDTSGDDLASRVARIRASLAHDDVAAALDAWNALPADAKAKADAWAALAKTHVDAMTAARALQRDAIAALATSKS